MVLPNCSSLWDELFFRATLVAPNILQWELPASEVVSGELPSVASRAALHTLGEISDREYAGQKVFFVKCAEDNSVNLLFGANLLAHDCYADQKFHIDADMYEFNDRSYGLPRCGRDYQPTRSFTKFQRKRLRVDEHVWRNFWIPGSLSHRTHSRADAKLGISVQHAGDYKSCWPFNLLFSGKCGANNVECKWIKSECDAINLIKKTFLFKNIHFVVYWCWWQ